MNSAADDDRGNGLDSPPFPFQSTPRRPSRRQSRFSHEDSLSSLSDVSGYLDTAALQVKEALNESLSCRYRAKSVSKALSLLRARLVNNGRADSFCSADAEAMCDEVFASVEEEETDLCEVSIGEAKEAKGELHSLIKDLWSAIEKWIIKREREFSERSSRTDSEREKRAERNKTKLMEKLEKLRNEKEEDKKKTLDISRQLSESEERTITLQDKNDQLEREVKEQRETLDLWADTLTPLQEKCEKRERELEESCKQIADQKRTIEEFRGENQHLNYHLKKTTEERQQLGLQCEQLKRHIEEQNVKVRQGEKDANSLINATNLLDIRAREIAAKNAGLHRFQIELGRLQMERNKLDQHSAALERRLREESARCQELTERLSKLTEAKEELFQDMTQRFKELTEAKKQSEEQLEIQKAANAELLAQNKKLQKRCEDYEKGKFVSWEWENDEGMWQAYDDVDAYRLDKAYHPTEGNLKHYHYFSRAEFDYRVDLERMTQMNMNTRKERRIRRTELPMSIMPPENWHRDDLQNQLICLNEDEDEYQDVKERFESSMAGCAVVKKIERVQNMTLWLNYEMSKLRIARQNGFVAEIKAFHGTRKNKPEDVFLGTAGFDVAMASEGVWGKGSYFAEKASYSAIYSYQHENGRTRQMLLAKVLTGIPEDNAKQDKNRTVPSIRPPTRHYYDSINAQTHDGKIHVVFVNGHSYPSHLISYESENREP